MTKDDIIRMAKEAGLMSGPVYAQGIERFAALVAAHFEYFPSRQPVQVPVAEFVEMVMEKEHLVGKPLVWAQWPNEEKK